MSPDIPQSGYFPPLETIPAAVLGDRGRAHHVDEQEEASLGVGPAILTKKKSPEGAIADEARGLKHHHHDGNGHERETDRNEPGARVMDGDDAH